MNFQSTGVSVWDVVVLIALVTAVVTASYLVYSRALNAKAKKLLNEFESKLSSNEKPLK